MTSPLLPGGFGMANEMLEQVKASQKNLAFEFYLKKNASANVILLDDEPQRSAFLHTMKVGANRYASFVCLGADEGCPGCAAGDRPMLVSYFSVMLLTHLPTVDEPSFDRDGDWELMKGATEIKTKAGAIVRNPIQVLVAKRPTIEKLSRIHDKKGGLKGWLFDVQRTNDEKSARVGDLWLPEKQYSDEQIAILNPKYEPLNWEEVLPIYPAEEIKRLLAGGNAAPSVREEVPSAAVATPPSAQGQQERPARKLAW